MILDTSAVLAVAFGEPSAAMVLDEISRTGQVLMSTVNLAETPILFRQRKPDTYVELFDELLAASARLQYPLNFGDCFAYALAKTQNLP